MKKKQIFFAFAKASHAEEKIELIKCFRLFEMREFFQIFSYTVVYMYTNISTCFMRFAGFIFYHHYRSIFLFSCLWIGLV